MGRGHGYMETHPDGPGTCTRARARAHTCTGRGTTASSGIITTRTTTIRRPSRSRPQAPPTFARRRCAIMATLCNKATRAIWPQAPSASARRRCACVRARTRACGFVQGLKLVDLWNTSGPANTANGTAYRTRACTHARTSRHHEEKNNRAVRSRLGDRCAVVCGGKQASGWSGFCRSRVGCRYGVRGSGWLPRL